MGERGEMKERGNGENVFRFLKSRFYSVSGFCEKFLFLNPSRIIVQKSFRTEQLII